MNYEITLPPDYIKPELPGGAEWVAALRSGKYAQGRRSLACFNDQKILEYCCLGVACEIQNVYKIPCGENYLFGGNATFLPSESPLFSYVGCMGSLPPHVVAQRKNDGKNFMSLAGMNDTGATFDDIANTIEQVWNCK